MENKHIIFEKIDDENYLIYIKKSEKTLIVSKLNLIIIKNYFSKKKSEFKQFLKNEHQLLNTNAILKELSQLSYKEKSKSFKIESLKNPKLSNKFSFKIENCSYTILHDNSVNMNDIFGQLYHLKTIKKSKDQIFIVFTKNNKIYLYHNNKFLGYWKLKNIHFLKGKILSIIICNYHNLQEKNFSAFLHGSIVNKSNKSFLIIGSSGSGKTSLAAILVKNGFKLICDDTAPLSNEGFFVHFPNALSIKKSKSGILSNYSFENFDKYSIKTYKGEITYLYPKRNEILKKHYYCDYIFRVQYEKNSNFGFSKSKKVEVLMQLLNDSFLPRNNKSIKSFMRWLNNVKFYDITYSNEKDVLNFIEKIK